MSIFLSTDLGDTWVRRYGPSTYQWGPIGTLIPLTRSRILCLGLGKRLLSTDAGLTWNEEAVPSVGFQVLKRTSTGTLVTGTHRSTDEGIT